MDVGNTEIAYSGRSDTDLTKALTLFTVFNNQALNRLGTGFTQWALKLGLPISPLLRATVFRLFCGGETLEDCKKTIADLARFGVITNLDYAVEAKQNEQEFDHTAKELHRILDLSAQSKSLQYTSIKLTGIARFAMLELNHRNQAEEQEWQRVIARLDGICSRAVACDIRLFIDAEESWIQDRIDELTIMMMRKYNQERPIIYGTWQLYRHDRLKHLQSFIEIARQEGFFIGAKLVRGAYLEKENDRAQALGYKSPIQPDRSSTDRDYNLAVDLCLKSQDVVALCAATHNEASVQNALQGLVSHPLKDKGRVGFAQLYGMGDCLTYNLAHFGHEVCKYVPYGPVREVVPYLIRRAEENSSIAGQMSRELSLLKKEIARRRSNPKAG